MWSKVFNVLNKKSSDNEIENYYYNEIIQSYMDNCTNDISDDTLQEIKS